MEAERGGGGWRAEQVQHMCKATLREAGQTGMELLGGSNHSIRPGAHEAHDGGAITGNGGDSISWRVSDGGTKAASEEGIVGKGE